MSRTGAGENVLKRVQQLQTALADATADASKWKAVAVEREAENRELRAHLDSVRARNEAAMASVIEKGQKMEALVRRLSKRTPTAEASEQCSLRRDGAQQTTEGAVQTLASCLHRREAEAQTPIVFEAPVDDLPVGGLSFSGAVPTDGAGTLPAGVGSPAMLLALDAVLQRLQPPKVRPLLGTDRVFAPVCVRGWWRWLSLPGGSHDAGQILHESARQYAAQAATDRAMDLPRLVELLGGAHGEVCRWNDVSTEALASAVGHGDTVLMRNRAADVTMPNAEGFVADVIVHNGQPCFLLTTCASFDGYEWEPQQEWVTAEQLALCFDTITLVPAQQQRLIDLRIPCSVDADGTVDAALLVRGGDLLPPRLHDHAGRVHEMHFVPRGDAWAVLCPEAVGSGISGCVMALTVPEHVNLVFCSPPMKLPCGTFDQPRKKRLPVQLNGSLEVVSEVTRQAVALSHADTTDASAQTTAPAAAAVIPSSVIGQRRISEMRDLIAEERFLESSAAFQVMAFWGDACDVLFQHAVAVVTLFGEAAGCMLLQQRIDAGCGFLTGAADALVSATEKKWALYADATHRQQAAADVGVVLARRFTQWAEDAGGLFQQGRLVQSHYWQREAPQLMVSYEMADHSQPATEDLVYFGAGAVHVVGMMCSLVLARLDEEIDDLLGVYAAAWEGYSVALEHANTHIATLEDRLMKPATRDVALQFAGDRAATAARSSGELRHRMQMAALTAGRSAQGQRVAEMEAHARQATAERVIATQRAQCIEDALDAAQREVAHLTLRLTGSEEERSSTVQRLAVAYERIDELQVNLHDCAKQLAQIESTQYTIRAEFEHKERETTQSRDALELQLHATLHTLRETEDALAASVAANVAAPHVEPVVRHAREFSVDSDARGVSGAAEEGWIGTPRCASSSSIQPLPAQFREQKPVHEQRPPVKARAKRDWRN